MENEGDKPKETYTHPKPAKWPYITFGIALICCIIIPITVFPSPKLGVTPFIISLVFCIPLGLFSLFGGLIKTFKDRRHIKGAIIRKLTRNFIIAEVFKQNKRKEFKTLKLNSDGITATDGTKDYVIDLEGVWYDESNFPHVHYVENVPNGLKFNFGDKLDTSKIDYSAENLQALKKDKFLAELHRPLLGDKERMMYLILIGVCVIAIVLIVLFMKGQSTQTIQVLGTTMDNGGVMIPPVVK